MFFNVGHIPLENYPCHWQLGSFCVNTDAGWRYKKIGSAEIVYKGYADDDILDNLLEQIVDQTQPKLTGNFCALVYKENKIKIQTDVYRSFPIYINHGVNNLIPQSRTAWSDSLITVNEDLTVEEVKFDVIGTIETATVSFDHAVDAITDILDRKTQQLLKKQLPIRAYLSGGVDTMLVYSFLKKHTSNYELIKYQHVDYDHFWLKNSHDIKKFWAYTQIHHWTDPCMLTSGTPGDEFMLRSPVTVDLFLKHHNIRTTDLLADPKWSCSLHYEYFCKQKHLDIFESQQAPVQSLAQMHWSLCNIVVNDWQHWHLGNTLTWTPLRDLEIFKLMLRLPLDHVIEQALDSRFSIHLIERNCPELVAGLSRFKNTGNMLSNLVNVF